MIFNCHFVSGFKTLQSFLNLPARNENKEEMREVGIQLLEYDLVDTLYVNRCRHRSIISTKHVNFSKARTVFLGQICATLPGNRKNQQEPKSNVEM